MRLAELIEGLPIDLVSGSPDAEISGLAEDSRRVEPGDLFLARPGTATHGRRYVRGAIARGAAAVLCEPPLETPAWVAQLGPRGPARTLNVASLTAELAERFFGRPSHALRVVGVTGTNGKTTTAHLVRSLLRAGGVRCGLIGTVEVDDGREVTPARLTTPSAIDLSGILRDMADAGCRACVMEASSHALEQRRVEALRFEGAVFTNLSGDHLDYHGTMDAYRAAKARLLDLIGPEGWAVVNVDDAAGPSMLQRCRGEGWGTSLDVPAATCHGVIDAMDMDGTAVTLDGPWGSLETRLPLVGRHNVANALQAAAVAWRLGLDGAAIGRGLSACQAPPGRLERVTPPDAPFGVLVDYAHTDDALENVLAALRPLVPPRGRLRVVFGCGGDRDRTKRPRMAAAAWRFADEVIITSDNPRTEDPQRIIDETFAGVPAARRARTLCLVDRAEAIGVAVASAREGDLVLVAGKGHEDYQIIGTTRRPFDDRAVARAAVAERLVQAAAP